MRGQRYCITDGKTFRLKDFDPADTGKIQDREAALQATEKDLKQIRELSERFYVDNRRALLIVLQAMDTAGKDGTIKHVFSGLNPVGTQVTSFKAPTEEEREHDFLWRISQALPARGNFGIFNRSHYEDVLIVRVHNLVPQAVWRRRYEAINAFEKHLADEGTLILKFFLHISKAEQKERLAARLADKDKHWKFDPKDVEERKYWKDYMAAYEEAIRRCSRPWAPWYVVPANKKWYRNYLVANAIHRTLSGLKLKLPEVKFDPARIRLD